tara:strand:+ start:489 stop:1175 length:687 start_codon:yes stop_codon:yes gene_type:complete
MPRVLLTLGDSWPQGGELSGDFDKVNYGVPYGVLLQKKLGFDQLHNYGSAGASNEDTLIQLQDYLKNQWQPTDNVTAIIHLTNPARTAHLPRFTSLDANSNERAHWPADAKQFIKDFVLHFHTADHEIMRSSTTVSALQYWCQVHNIQDYYFSGWVKYPAWLPGVNLTKIWATGNETAADWFGATSHNGEHLTNVETNPYIKPNFAHPNQLGHQLIADKLASWIQLAP